ncbi:hypothetical protein [Actinomadura latina]|nr:hypothetical protein [Actinomadura latina]
MSRQTLAYATGVVRRRRKKIGSQGRALPPGPQCVRSMGLCQLC